ncbi:major facilitator superfamily domain-containing protein 6-A-like [Argiope bruennichi]|uniref:major facilitator superfamily domain-containing protein 6-A-like n=1 Tax=Argiope bruennichi TaxID=94029 RepID=UPI0024955EBD|nr:major facilitator superfamily domain-containing protein 6-A-like [Argiope bruennichi]XP_055935603.1 major facilitator superfamily domain-containing protein 6-A-like [Argiope bruennichi]
MASTENKNSTDVYIISYESTEKLQKEKPERFDKDILRYKIIFFLHNGGLAAAFFYIAVIAKEQVGLTSSSLGAVLTVQMFLFTFTKPLIGYITDYFNSLKITICVLTILDLACFFSLFAIPKIDRGGVTNSSTIFEEKVYNATNLCDQCQDFLQIVQNTSDFPLVDSSGLNLKDNQFHCQSYMLCYLKNETYFDSSNIFSIVNNSEGSVSYLNKANTNKQNCVLFCERNDTFSANFHSNRNISCQNFTNCIELNYLQNLKPNKRNQMLKNVSFISCPEMLKNLQKTPALRKIEETSENRLTDSTTKYINDFYTYQFWMFAILFTISNICENANFTLVDTACCENIEKSKADFGKLRLWGNVGWGLFSPIGGLLNDYTGGFFASTVVMAALLLSFMYNIIQLDLVKPNYSSNICRDVGTVFRSKEFLSVELINLMNGIGSGIVWFYLSWFLTGLGGSKLQYGLSVAVQSFGGVIPFMFFSGWIIRKIGHYRIVSFTLLINGLRFLFYSELYEPWWILPIELSHGITYGLYYATLATYGKLKAKPGTEATTQSILFTTHEGLGAGIGCGFAGIGFDYFGAHQTFFFLSAYFGFDFLLSLLMYFLFVRKQKKCITINSKL